jgi:hypothetical protein
MRKRMKRLVAAVVMAIVLILITISVMAVDILCMQRCLSQGYMYGYCEKVCSY